MVSVSISRLTVDVIALLDCFDGRHDVALEVQAAEHRQHLGPVRGHADGLHQARSVSSGLARCNRRDDRLVAQADHRNPSLAASVGDVEVTSRAVGDGQARRDHCRRRQSSACAASGDVVALQVVPLKYSTRLLVPSAT